MLVFNLSEEQLAVQAMARAFADGELRPAAEKLDRSQDILRDFPWALVRKGGEMGLRTLGLPKEYGGLELDWRSRVLLLDELAYADSACARIFSQNWTLCETIAACGTATQKQRFLAAFRDDNGFLLAGDGELAAQSGVSARRDGAQYLLNGTRAGVSLGAVAKLLLVNTSAGVFLVPAGSPGVTVVSCEDRVGLRADVQARVSFENVKVVAENLLGGKEGRFHSDCFSDASSVEVSALAMGLARAALDAATRYATERVQGGGPIIGHQAVALAIADMFIVLQAGRSLLWRAACELDSRGRIDRQLRLSTRLFCAQAAIKIARDAIELFGGAGVMRELPMQKYFRDALVLSQLDTGEHVDVAAIGESFANGQARGVPAMTEFGLSEEHQKYRDMARSFSEKEILPIADKLDRSENLLAEFPWDLIKKGSRLGLRTLSVPKEFGGPGIDMITWLVMIDELGYHDITCAKIFTQCWKLSRLIAQAGTKEQKERFFRAYCEDDTFLLAGAQTEPNSGSDSHLPYDAPNAGVMLSAQRQGDHYVLNGRKHFVSLAPVAKLLIVMGRTDRTVGTSIGTSAFLVPRDTPGLSFGAVHDKLGFRMYLQGEFSFDNARVPAESLLGGREGGTAHEGVASNIELAAYANVVARSALDAAIAWVNRPREGGGSGSANPGAGAVIGEMVKELEAARTLLWRATWLADNGKADRSLTMAAKVFCTEVAVKISLAALELVGASGVTRRSALQKYVRDAVALPHMDATNPINKLKITRFLETWIGEGRLPEWGRQTAGVNAAGINAPRK